MAYSEVLTFIDDIFIGKFSISKLNELITSGKIIEDAGYSFKVKGRNKSFSLQNVKYALAKTCVKPHEDTKDRDQIVDPMTLEFCKETSNYRMFEFNESSSFIRGNVYISKESIQDLESIRMLLEEDTSSLLMSSGSFLGTCFLERHKTTKNYDVYRLTSSLGLTQQHYNEIKKQRIILPFCGNIYFPVSKMNKESMRVHFLKA
ncbi:hypothetical protein BIY24_03785 [Halobacteriovorax marinus]|uniref:hypothetical protein n=1 Tax=Halobacteriovorax marinus TaxID=97084 RepID=UPI000BC2FA24|nr:hypothetical protein [Halobacteriovorax marinus]ATH07087.1 hypothetical protein BIY24_03785 [Halobacteriovorax marinus]